MVRVAKHPRSDVTRLSVRRDRTHLDMPETQRRRRPRKLRILVHARRQTHSIRKIQSEQTDRCDLSDLIANTQDFVYRSGTTQGLEAKDRPIMGSIRIKQQ